MDMALTLGLDIGIASVGWGIIDMENQEIIDGAVRLFSVGTAEENQTRREKRGGRRRKQRHQHRLETLRKLLVKTGFPEQPITLENPYELRVKGLTEPLTKEEFTTVFYHLLKHRGISYLEGESLEALSENQGEDDYTHQLQQNLMLLKTAHPCEIQWHRYQTYGQCRGVFEGVDKEGNVQWICNIFPNAAYVKEAEAILAQQSKTYPEIVEVFQPTYLDLLTRKRPFYVGPGNEKSRTDYGIYRTTGETLAHLYADLIGTCSIFPEEKRTARFSPKAQQYNFLNDLNNLSIEGKKLTPEDKKDLYYQLIQSKTATGSEAFFKKIAKFKGVTLEDIQGYRLSNKGKPEIHTMEGQVRLERWMEKQVQESLMEQLSVEEWERLAYLFALNENVEGLRTDLMKESWVQPHWIESLVLFRQKHKKLCSGWHSLSEKALDTLLPHLWKTELNQMQILKSLNLLGQKQYEQPTGKYIPKETILKEMSNPVVRRSVSETIKVVNALIKKYGIFDHIVIEMARDWNPKEDKKAIEKEQRANAERIRKALTAASVEYPLWQSHYEEDPSLRLKIELWDQQQKTCPYSGDIIRIEDLVTQPHLFEIDHIIPKSISFDDSKQNKVLCYSTENQAKGQRSPYDYLMSEYGKSRYDAFKQRVLSWFNQGKGTLPKRKKELLLHELSLTKYENRLAFKHRNLNDTRYASKLVLNGLQDFVEVNQLPTKVHTVRGKFTAQLRRQWELTKKRDESHAHHLMDALVVAAVPHLALFKGQSSTFMESNDLLPTCSSEQYDQKVQKLPYPMFLTQLAKQVRQCRYSYKVDTLANRKLSDETIYSTRTGFKQEGKVFVPCSNSTERFIVGKFKDFYTKDNSLKLWKQLSESPSSFLMYHHNPTHFQQILEALAPYQYETNPILSYYQEKGPLVLIDKNGVTTPIRQFKYLAERFNQGIQIQHHYSTNRVIALCSTNPWRTDVYYHRPTGKYRAIGLKYYHAKFQSGGAYGITPKDYHRILTEQNLSLSEDEFKMLMEKHETEEWVFCFSLYKDQLFEATKKEERIQTRHWSYDLSGKRLVVKRIEMPEAGQKPLPRLTVSTLSQFVKLNQDVLGHTHRIYREPLRLQVNY